MESEEKEEGSLIPKEEKLRNSPTPILVSTLMKKFTELTSVIAKENSSQTRYLQRIDNLLFLIVITSSIIASAIVVGVVYLLKNLFALLTISFLIAYVFSPIVTYFEHRGVNRTLVVIIISLTVLSGIVLTFVYTINVVYGQIMELKDELTSPEFSSNLGNKLEEWNVWLKSLPIVKEYIPKDYDLTEKIRNELVEKAVPIIQSLFSSSRYILPSVVSAIIMISIVPFLTFFILNSGRDIKKSLINVVPNSIFEPTLLLLDELDRQLGQYIRSRMIIETIALSILASIGYWILGLKFFFLLGIFAGLANLIPYIGPTIGAIPAVIVAFLGSNFGLIWTIILIIIISFAVQFVDNVIIFPLFIGKSVDLGPITTTFAILIGAKLLGLLGLLMAVPIAAMLKVILFEIFRQFKGYMRIT